MVKNCLSIFKAFPPSGGFLNPFALLLEIFKQFRSNTSFENLTLFPDHSCYLVNSGKTALYLFFKTLKQIRQEDEVAMAAYTCPDVASAAIRAGYKIRLIDLEKNSTNIKVTEEKIKNCSAVVLSNLYGIPDDVQYLENTYVVDDACQAALSMREFDQVGVSLNKIGVFSFGRGKAYSSVGGGFLLVPKKFEELNLEISKNFLSFKSSSYKNLFFNLIKSFIYYFLERPFFYRLLLFMPGLGIGETKVNLNFEIKRGGVFEKAILIQSKRNTN
jgi:hypothetical protein